MKPKRKSAAEYYLRVSLTLLSYSIGIILATHLLFPENIEYIPAWLLGAGYGGFVVAQSVRKRAYETEA